jgi:hypothetical protein
MEYFSRMNKEKFPTSREEVLETLLELETLSNLTLDGTETSNKLSSVLSTSKEEPEKGPKIINVTDGSHGFNKRSNLCFYENTYVHKPFVTLLLTFTQL